MNEPRMDRVQELFNQAVSLPAGERSEYLRTSCAGDAALRAEVESLLSADAGISEGSEGVLQSPLVRATMPIISRSPERLGRYRILQRLGSGGMGDVYEAKQDNPSRIVALKVARQGLERSSIQRFQQEAQILGRLNHPGIAQIYESGLDEQGQPFFAMELVRGLRLDHYARNKSLTLPARLELIARVCDAVQYAHELGIIHRDLKPANILVEESGQPKILDFGLARATEDDWLVTAARVTQTGQILGTPDYMSPEQLSGEPAVVDQRADVYAIGVILFELLAGQLPYKLEHKSLAVVTRLIQEEDAPLLRQFRPELRGDIEVIVARALEKDHARRYQSARELSADLRRFLAQEPVQARLPSALYQFRKLVRRHKALVGGVVATVVALMLGLIGTVLFAVGESRQREQAELNAKTAVREKSQSEFQTYRARMAAAVAALSAHDVADAKLQLDLAPQNLRGWEWQHLYSRLDDSSSVTPLKFAAGAGAFLTGAPDQLRVGMWTPNGLSMTDLEGTGQKIVPAGALRSYHVTAMQTREGFRIAGWLDKKTFAVLNEAGEVVCRGEIPTLKSPQPIAQSPDGSRLVIAHWENQNWRLEVFDSKTGKRMAACDGHRGEVWGYTFSPDSTLLASVCEDNMARLWDPVTGKLLTVFQGHTSKVLGVAFRQDGKRLVTTSADGTVRQWDATTGREVEAPYDRHVDEVAAAVYSPDGQLIASVGTDRTIRVWRATGRQDVTVLHGHTGPVVQVAFSPDGRQLASLSQTWIFSAADETVRVWDLNARSTLPVLRGHTKGVYPVAYSPDGRWLASGSWDKTGRLWDAATGKECGSLPHPGAVASLAYSPDGKWLVTGNYSDDQLRIWDPSTAHVRKVLKGPPGTIRFVTVSPDGKRIASTGYDGNKHHLQVCDVASGEQLYAAEGRAFAFSSDGNWLATSDKDERTVLLLNARTHELITRFHGHEKVVHGAIFSADSRCLGSYGQDRTVRLWNLETRGCQVLRGHTEDVFAAAFHPDGTRLATAGRDRAIWIWDIDHGEEVARLGGHTSFVWSLAFSKDGNTLASGSGDNTVRLWDTKPLKERYSARRKADEKTESMSIELK